VRFGNNALSDRLDLPVAYPEYDWYPLVDNIRDPGPFVISPVPRGGEFAVLSPTSDASNESVATLEEKKHIHALTA